MISEKKYQAANRKKKGARGGGPASQTPASARRGHSVECLINGFKAWRGVATRYDKTAGSCLAAGRRHHGHSSEHRPAGSVRHLDPIALRWCRSGSTTWLTVCVDSGRSQNAVPTAAGGNPVTPESRRSGRRRAWSQAGGEPAFGQLAQPAVVGRSDQLPAQRFRLGPHADVHSEYFADLPRPAGAWRPPCPACGVGSALRPVRPPARPGALGGELFTHPLRTRSATVSSSRSHGRRSSPGPGGPSSVHAPRPTTYGRT